jgi:membrane protease YdiL (CAAX protease family)
VFFALAHAILVGGSSATEGFGFAVFAFTVRLPVAFVLGWFFLRRRSLWGPVALHAAYNGIAVVATGIA